MTHKLGNLYKHEAGEKTHNTDLQAYEATLPPLNLPTYVKYIHSVSSTVQKLD